MGPYLIRKYDAPEAPFKSSLVLFPLFLSFPGFGAAPGFEPGTARFWGWRHNHATKLPVFRRLL